MTLAIFDPDIPDWIRRCTLEEFLRDNEEGLSEAEQSAVAALSVGESYAISTGGGCFQVIYCEGTDVTVHCEDGQYFALHSGRPEPISWGTL